MRTTRLLLAALTASSLGALPARAQQRPANAPPPTDSATQANLRAEQRDDPKYAPDRKEGEGPFTKLIIRGATLIDGTGGPPRGPVDIVIEGNRITDVAGVGFPNVPIDSSRRPKGPAREIDGNGMYVIPGIVDLHV